MKNLKLKLFGPVLLISLFIGLVACEAETIAEMEPPKDAPSKAMNDGPPPKKGPPPLKKVTYLLQEDLQPLTKR
ncbi:MAG: hypothetical protein CL712_06175 [Chloroflexi bacterium]|nr:hypothetical protein [Chloroflexota bacterium]